jgi:hypothetical protein
MTNPFLCTALGVEAFDPNKAKQLVNLAEKICDDEQQAALHLAACLMRLVPDLEYARLLCKCVDIQDQPKYRILIDDRCDPPNILDLY